MERNPLIPVSTAHTLWELCEEVIALMLLEPKRVDMTCVIKHDYFQSGAPACNTAGCFAGWLGLLALPDMVYSQYTMASYINAVRTFVSNGDPDRSESNISFSLERRIRKTGPICVLKYCNCSGDWVTGDLITIDVFDDGSRGDIVGTPGTLEYAESVVERIREFMALNHVALQARRLTK